MCSVCCLMWTLWISRCGQECTFAGQCARTSLQDAMRPRGYKSLSLTHQVKDYSFNDFEILALNVWTPKSHNFEFPLLIAEEGE